MTDKLIRFADNPERGDTGQGVIAKLNVMWEAAETERKKAEGEWYANAAALAGKQADAVVKDVELNRKIKVPYMAKKANVNVNLLYPLVRQAAAAGVDAAARQVAIPATSEPQDIYAAELATDLIAHRYDADDEETLRLHEELWRLTTGLCFRNTYWDPKKPGYGLDGIIMPNAGDIETRTLTPLHVHVCPWADSSKPRPWYIVSDVRDTDEIGDLYGVKVEPEDVADQTKMLDQLLSNIVTDGTSTPARRKNAVILKRLYHVPGPKHPQGKVWTWANGVLLQESTLPEGEMPFVEEVWFPVPGRIYPYPFVTPLVGLQREINRTINQMVELKNRQLRGDIVVRGQMPTEETQSPVTTDWDAETGQKRIWIDNTVQDFEFMRYDLNTNDAQALIALKWENMQRIAGLHDPSTGETSAQAQTATEIAVLKEADTAGLALFRNIRNHAQSKIDRQKIVIARNHYAVPRFIRVTGENNAPKTAFFYGAELRGVDDVRPRPVPMMTEAMKQQIRRDLAGLGAWDLSGPIEVKAGKVKLIMESGLPDPDTEVETLTGGVTVEEIYQANGQAIRLAMDMELKQGVMAEAQADAMMGAGEGEEAAPESVAAAMMGGG